MCCRWLFEGEELVAGDGVELDPENGDLRIGALTYDNTGSYTCVAETGAGSDNLTHSVSVEGKMREEWSVVPCELA